MKPNGDKDKSSKWGSHWKSFAGFIFNKPFAETNALFYSGLEACSEANRVCDRIEEELKGIKATEHEIDLLLARINNTI
jgi:hypothetical protein